MKDSEEAAPLAEKLKHSGVCQGPSPLQFRVPGFDRRSCLRLEQEFTPAQYNSATRNPMAARSKCQWDRVERVAQMPANCQFNYLMTRILPKWPLVSFQSRISPVPAVYVIQTPPPRSIEIGNCVEKNASKTGYIVHRNVEGTKSGY